MRKPFRCDRILWRRAADVEATEKPSLKKGVWMGPGWVVYMPQMHTVEDGGGVLILSLPGIRLTEILP